jgi:hypothetical protein
MARRKLKPIRKFTETKSRRMVLAIFIISFAVLGTVQLIRSFAATSVVSFEAEGGAKTANARIVSDLGASAGNAVQFTSGGTSACTALFCDNFENYTAGTAPNGSWTVSSATQVTVDSVHTFSGTKSVHFTGLATNDPRLITKATLPNSNNNVFGRFMLWQSQVPNRNHSNFIAGLGQLPTGGLAVYNWGGHYGEFMSNYSVTDGFTLPGGMWKVGQWTCIEWQFDGSPNPAGGTMDELRIWQDGILTGYVPTEGGDAATHGGGGRYIAPKFDTIEIGQRLTDIYTLDYSVDDFALSNARIGCPN